VGPSGEGGFPAREEVQGKKNYKKKLGSSEGAMRRSQDGGASLGRRTKGEREKKRSNLEKRDLTRGKGKVRVEYGRIQSIGGKEGELSLKTKKWGRIDA